MPGSLHRLLCSESFSMSLAVLAMESFECALPLSQNQTSLARNISAVSAGSACGWTFQAGFATKGGAFMGQVRMSNWLQDFFALVRLY